MTKGMKAVTRLHYWLTIAAHLAPTHGESCRYLHGEEAFDDAVLCHWLVPFVREYQLHWGRRATQLPFLQGQRQRRPDWHRSVSGVRLWRPEIAPTIGTLR